MGKIQRLLTHPSYRSALTSDFNDYNDFILKRDALRKCQKFKNAEALEAPLNLLAEHGYIKIEKVKSNGSGRPQERIWINPKAIEETDK